MKEIFSSIKKKKNPVEAFPAKLDDPQNTCYLLLAVNSNVERHF